MSRALAGADAPTKPSMKIALDSMRDMASAPHAWKRHALLTLGLTKATAVIHHHAMFTSPDYRLDACFWLPPASPGMSTEAAELRKRYIGLKDLALSLLGAWTVLPL